MGPTDVEYTTRTKCSGLVKKIFDSANREFIPLCPGITGEIGGLIVDSAHERDTSEIPIDSYVLDLTKEEEMNE